MYCTFQKTQVKRRVTGKCYHYNIFLMSNYGRNVYFDVAFVNRCSLGTIFLLNICYWRIYVKNINFHMLVNANVDSVRLRILFQNTYLIDSVSAVCSSKRLSHACIKFNFK